MSNELLTIVPRDNLQFLLMMRAQEGPLANMQPKDNFLLQCVVTGEATMRMATKLGVISVTPPIKEGSQEDIGRLTEPKARGFSKLQKGLAGVLKVLLYCFHLALLVSHLLCFLIYYHLLRSHTEPHASSASSEMLAIAFTATGINLPQYQVFINFRGAELRNNFFGFLVKAMTWEKINVFMDEVEFRGTNLNSLFSRIEESKVAVAIFTERYTESSWCLDELVKMNEQMEQGRLVVVPVFYKVDPTACANMFGAFGDNFRKLEWEYRSEPERIHKWKEALSSVFKIMGLKLDIGSDESKFVDLIVEELKKVLIKISVEKEKAYNSTIETRGGPRLYQDVAMPWTI